MSITHEQLRKYSYNRWMNSSKPIQEIIEYRKQSNPQITDLHNEISIQFEKQNKEINASKQQLIEKQINESDQIQLSNEQDQNQKLRSNLNKSEQNKIFQPLSNHNFLNQQNQIFNQSNQIINQKGMNFTIKEQYNICVNSKLQQKIDKQKNEHSIQEVHQQEVPQNQFFLPQINQISQYIEVSHQVDEQNEVKEVDQEIELQELMQENKNENQLRSDFISSNQNNDLYEQPFPQNVQMDVDYNKDEYLKVINDYIEFIESIDYTDVQLIEPEILKYQHIISQKEFMQKVEPLIVKMLFQNIPQNPFQKDSDLHNTDIEFDVFQDILKKYKSQLENDEYVSNLSDFMHFQLSQKTFKFLEVKRKKIIWTPKLFKEIQMSRNELMMIFQIYNQIKQPDIVLYDADIAAFELQIKQSKQNQIYIFQNLFRKYKNKTLKRLKDLKLINHQVSRNKSFLSKSKTEYQNMIQQFQYQLEQFRNHIEANQSKSPIDFQIATSLIKEFNIIQSLYIQIKKHEKDLNKEGQHYIPIVFHSEIEVLKIFDLMYINLKQEILKTKKLIQLPIKEFGWEYQLEQEEESFNKVKRRLSLLNQFYEQSKSKYKTEYQFIRQLQKGQILLNDNINILMQYLDIKRSIHNQKISMFSYPQYLNLQQITNSTLLYHDLVVQTNNKLIAIQQLNQYQFIENLKQILSQENYNQVNLQLLDFKNQLNLSKFSKLIQDEVTLLHTYVAKALCFFPNNLMNIFINTKTYEEIELELGNIEQFEELENHDMESQSQELFEIFKNFFETKIQNQFDQIFIELYEMSQDQHSNWNPIILSERIDLLYEYIRVDMENPYVKQELINQIIDQPNLRYLFQEARQLFVSITKLIEDENNFDKNNQKILTLISEFEAPEGIDSTLINLQPLVIFHRNLKQLDQYSQLKNQIVNLGLILQQEYGQYLLTCQNKIKKLMSCSELKINTLDKEILDNILFQPLDKYTKVPIYELHTLINFCYTDFQSIKFQKFANDKQRNIILFKKKLNQIYDEDNDIVLEVIYDKIKVHNIEILIDQQLCFSCE